MLQSFLSQLRASASNDRVERSRRQHVRRQTDRSVLVIYGQTFPVKDWSLGGLQIVGDDRLFGVGQELEFTIKFKLRNTILDVKHRGAIVRKGHSTIGIKFEPITKTVQRAFQQVIDDAVAREFANSQVTT